jgi:drug/metabolite transporter (DMT)-like permease
MSTSAVALVLLAAFLHASWNAVLRISGDRFIVMALLNGSAGVVAAVLIPFAPLPAPASWPNIALSAVLHTGYNLFLVAAYAHGGLGQVYPIARGSAPLLVLALAWLLLGEAVSGTQLVAVVIVCAGIAALALRGGRVARLSGTGVACALATAGFIGAYTVTDAAGARVAGSPHGYALWLFLLDGISAMTLALWWRGRAVLATARTDWRPALAAGGMALAGYWLVIWALTLAPAATVAALRETSVVIAALIGTFLLNEPMGAWRVAAAVVVAVGAVMLRL